MRLVRVLVVLAVVASVLAPSSGVGSDSVAAQTVGGLCDAEGVEQFSDVGAGDYGAAYVLCMRALGLSVGRPDGGFGPDAELTRGQMASFLVRLWRDVLGRECPEEGASPFVDVAGSVHEVNIECLFGLGVTMGITAVSYGPGERLKASQISRFLLRTYEKTGGRCEAGGDELDRALSCLLGLGVIPSKAEGAEFGTVTRAQMAVYVIGLWHNIAGLGAAPPAPGKPVGRMADGEDEPVTVPVRVDRVDLDHIDAGDVRVGLGFENPVGVGGGLSGAGGATSLALAVDGENRLQGASLVVAGDTAVDVHIDYKTTATALVLQTPGLATLDPMITLGLVSLLADLDETDVLADQLEADAASYGGGYLLELSPETRRALSDTVDALIAGVEDLADTTVSTVDGSYRSGYQLGREAVQVGGPVAGVGLGAAPDGSAGEHTAGSGPVAAAAGDCEPVWDPADGGLGSWDPLGRTTRPDDGVCLEGSVKSLGGENESWSALMVPVSLADGGGVRFFEGGEMYISSKTVDIPTLFGDVLWGLGKNLWCVTWSIPIEILEWGSFGLLQNPLYCDWDNYFRIFRVNSGGTIDDADLRPLYDHNDPVRRLAIIKSNWAGNNPYQDRLTVANPARLATLQRTATIYEAVHFLTPALGVIVGKGIKKVTGALKTELAEVLADSGNRFITAADGPVVDFAATLTKLIVDRLLDKEDVVDLTSPGRSYSPEEKRTNLERLMSLILPTLEAVLKSAVKKALVSAVPVVGQIIAAIDSGIGAVNVAGTWVQALFGRGHDTVSFYAEGTPPPPPKSPTAAPAGPFEAVSSGGFFSCGLRTNGTITCWGQNIDGQAEPPAGIYTAVSAGGQHACGIHINGATTCWGFNQFTQADPPDRTYTAVAAGGLFTCGIRSTNRSVECWGGDTFGETMNEPSGAYTAVAAGLTHACTLATDRTIACWGDNGRGQTSPPSGTYTTITAGWGHSCGIRTDRTLTCWGRDDNYYGQDPPSGTYTAVSAGNNHTCAIRSDGTIACWGDNSAWQATPPSGTYTSLASGHQHTCAIRADRTIACWGNNQRPPQDTQPQSNFLSSDHSHSCAIRTDQTIACWGSDFDTGRTDAPHGTFTAVSAGGGHSCAITTDRTIACWGDNNWGATDAPSGTFIAVSSGSYHSCAIRTDQTITCWSDTNIGGQTTPPAGTFTAIDAGDQYTCAIRTDQTIACWGLDFDIWGRTDVPAGTFTAVSTGAVTCAIRTDQTIACWGSDSDILGWTDVPAGTFTALSQPCGIRTDQTIACWAHENILVGAKPPAGTFTAISSVGQFACAIRTDRTIACWGANHSGQSNPPIGTFGSPR